MKKMSYIRYIRYGSGARLYVPEDTKSSTPKTFYKHILTLSTIFLSFQRRNMILPPPPTLCVAIYPPTPLKNPVFKGGTPYFHAKKGYFTPLPRYPPSFVQTRGDFKYTSLLEFMSPSGSIFEGCTGVDC